MKKSKYVLVFASVLIFGLCLMPALSQAAPAQKLEFYAMEWLAQPPTYTITITGGIVHMKDYYDIHWLAGTIEDEEISGYTESFFHVIDDTIGKAIVNGESYMYFTWGELSGYFYGRKCIRVINGELTGHYSMQGFEDFEGMKLMGLIYGNIIVNYFEATLLIPN
ncbi:MAG: hypothetical protein GOP50_02360 [Candidatus Heimdallarchaeota archaeon]|nr:hypothetical protein [Candidatus Heimdallarchaeota archaeon]